MKLNEALAMVKIITKQRSGFILCGSVALAHLGVIHRPLNDIDFVCYEDEFDPSGIDTYGDYGPWEQDNYTCWKVTADKKTGHYYNVFVFGRDVKIDFKEVKGIKVQSPYQFLQWKKKYNRQKDVNDIFEISEKFQL